MLEKKYSTDILFANPVCSTLFGIDLIKASKKCLQKKLCIQQFVSLNDCALTEINRAEDTSQKLRFNALRILLPTEFQSINLSVGDVDMNINTDTSRLLSLKNIIE